MPLPTPTAAMCFTGRSTGARRPFTFGLSTRRAGCYARTEEFHACVLEPGTGGWEGFSYRCLSEGHDADAVSRAGMPLRPFAHCW